MISIFNRKILKLIPYVFIIVFIIKVTYLYNGLVDNEKSFAKQQAEILNAYNLVHRNYYQQLFINKIIILNKKTLKALPAHSNIYISKDFSKNNLFNITVRSVSDKPRNSVNMADKDELKAIKFLNKNKNKTKYFNSDNPKFYQYASALKINKQCLLCHGKKENAPKFIQKNYDKAYDYKIGDIRGIISIKIPKENIKKYFFKNFLESILFDISMLILLFLGIYYLLRKTNDINKMLNEEVDEKTSALKNIFLIDKLTQLPNRRKLFEDLPLKADILPKHLALLNIDSFKDINDFYGHETGDFVLQGIADILLEEFLCLETSIYKMPSDEFVVFTTKKITNKEFLKKISTTIDKIHKKSFLFNSNKVFIILTCGISSNQTKLLNTADVALKFAKNKNKNIVVYDNSMNKSLKIIENTNNLNVLKDALDNNYLTPYFQPIYNVITKQIDKYECLARIVKGDGTIILPYKFLEVALKSKQYHRITKTMINKSFEYFKDKDFEFSINLSIEDMISKDMILFITQRLENFSNPKRVVFEILENDNLGNYEEIRNFIKVVKKYNCKFAIDDFGSGYSNFSHILELDVDYLKIDASLVKNISNDENSKIITKTIVNFADNLGLKTIAEYVEDKKSFEILNEMGVDFIQGYYIGKPSKDIKKDVI